jgi:predicted TIM-barrel fold metal-dependent hydrolase
MTSTKSAAEIRAELGHPVIDNDGHTLEMLPALVECVREVGGGAIADKYLAEMEKLAQTRYGKGSPLSPEQRHDAWVGKTSWWSMTSNSVDRATSMLPRLFMERLGELGIDFAILYPSDGLFANRFEDEELRQVACRAVNLYQSEMFKGCEQHLAPVALIPMGTPAEALEELNYAVQTLGFKTTLMTSGSRRPIGKFEREYPEAAHLLRRADFYGMDSEYDYDPVWRRCVELGVPVSFHGQTIGTWAGPTSVTNNCFNRLAAVGNNYPALLLSLLLGGVLKRVPELKFVFQEAGAGWLSSVYSQVLGVWEKRSAKGITELDPARLDIAKLKTLVKEYGGTREQRHIDWLDTLTEGLVAPEVLDEFGQTGATTAQDLRDIFTTRFYAGCEADDATTGHAVSGNPLGAELKTTFGSDIGHWDVFDAQHVLPEVMELVEDDILNPDQLRNFLFDNAVELYTATNPNFFDGTVLEHTIKKTTTQPTP